MDDFKVRAEAMGQLLSEFQDGNAWDSTITLLCDYADLAQDLLGDREQTVTTIAAKDAEIARLRQALADIANQINVADGPLGRVYAALDKAVEDVKRKTRTTLRGADHD